MLWVMKVTKLWVALIKNTVDLNLVKMVSTKKYLTKAAFKMGIFETYRFISIS